MDIYIDNVVIAQLAALIVAVLVGVFRALRVTGKAKAACAEHELTIVRQYRVIADLEQRLSDIEMPEEYHDNDRPTSPYRPEGGDDGFPF